MNHGDHAAKLASFSQNLHLISDDNIMLSNSEHSLLKKQEHTDTKSLLYDTSSNSDLGDTI